jgi:glycosyltransferase 2 family protein
MTKQTKGMLRQAAGYAIGIGCLVWVFHDVHAGRLFEQFAEINWWLVAAAVVLDICGYAVQGFRWTYLIRPLGRLGAIRATQAVYAGLFTNEILPLRMGEVVRIFLVSRWLSSNFMSVVPSVAIERVLDGIWLFAGIGLAALFVRLPQNLMDGADILGAIMLAATAVFVWLVLRKQQNLDLIKPPSGPAPVRFMLSTFRRLSGGIRDIGIGPNLFIAFGSSVFILVFQILSFWLVMAACGISNSLWIGAVVYLIVHLGTAIPNAPSNAGSYQLFCVLGLSLFGIDKTAAAGFSVVVFLILTIPLWALGLIAINRTGMSLSSIRIKITELTGNHGNQEKP